MLRAREGRSFHAARLAGAIAKLSRVFREGEIAIHRERVREVELRARRDLGDDYAAAWEAGRALTLEQAIAEALDEGA